MMGAEYSIADILLPGRVRDLVGFCEARELVSLDRFLHVQAWLDRDAARAAGNGGLDPLVSVISRSARPVRKQ